MIKAVITPLCVTLLLAAATPLRAQNAPAANPAVEEGVRRQAAQIQLRATLQEAAAAQQRRDLPAAAKLYGDAWRLVESIGPGVELEAQQTVTGLTAVRSELARAAQRRGDFRDAQVHINEILRVNPTDEVALAMKAANDRVIVEMTPRTPSVEVQAQAPAIQKEKETAQIHVQNGRFFYEAGKYEEAEQELKLALKINPNNEAAHTYITLVQQAKYKQISNRRERDAGKKIVEVQDAWNDPVKRDLLPTPNPMARTNLINTSSSRQAIMSKLDRIRLDAVSYDSLPLSEVIRSLSEEVKRRDPLKRGINFLINPNQDTVSMTPVTFIPGAQGAGGFGQQQIPQQLLPQQQPLIDPLTGLPITAAPTLEEPVDVNAVTIRINPPLLDVRLADVLDAIITVADHPIKYSLTDYAVIFSLKGPETPNLVIRTFRVDPNTFYQGLESVSGIDFSTLVPTTTTTGGGGVGGGGGGGFGGGGGGQGGQNGQNTGVMTIPRVSVTGVNNQGGGGGGQGQGGQGGVGLSFVSRTNLMATVQTAVIQFFATVGVDLSPLSGKNVFWNDREGTLMVRATSQELDVIEAAIQTLNIAPPQINVKTKFVEVTQNDSKAIGFDWYLGNFLMGNNALGVQGGTAPSYSSDPTDANPIGEFPGSTVGGTAIAPRSTDQLVTGGLRNAAPALGTLSGILTDPQFRVVLRALEQRDGADVLTQGEVTTLSGRQAQIQVIDLRFIVTAVTVQTDTGNAAGGGTGATVQTAALQTILPIPSPIPLGPTLDVLPYVSADGYSIQMTLIPTVTEFIGYDDPGQFAIQSQGVGAGGAAADTLTAPVALPRFRVRQVTTSVNVYDGQTVVLGGLLSDNMIRTKDKVPVLGDLPFVGRLFRSESNQTQKKNLLIFVTPTIIDPAGNRKYTDEELPFAMHSVPVQPVATP